MYTTYLLYTTYLCRSLWITRFATPRMLSATAFPSQFCSCTLTARPTHIYATEPPQPDLVPVATQTTRCGCICHPCQCRYLPPPPLPDLEHTALVLHLPPDLYLAGVPQCIAKVMLNQLCALMALNVPLQCCCVTYDRQPLYKVVLPAPLSQA